ncbi:hypothetical protein EYC80_010017 [Monilinia laxa]|uniref:Uncharacterized protein n=1 Tax=Monilinia laxa TaxID=61186 RepID=A0A5N6JTZ9_MONLA|nr:hypothetical protein EYC80_010017 [Monilinia laxa]
MHVWTAMWSVNLQTPYLVEPDASGYINHPFLSAISALAMMYKEILLWVSIQYILRLHDVYAWLEGEDDWKHYTKVGRTRRNGTEGKATQYWEFGLLEDVFLYSGMIPIRAVV